MGETVQVLVEEVEEDGVIGRAAHQGPEVDGQVQLQTGEVTLAVGDLVIAVVVASEGADLVADLVPDEVSRRAGG